MRFVFGEPQEWSREMVHQAITIIASGAACPGCGVDWVPYTSGGRFLRHDDACPYIAGLARYGI